MRRWFCFLLALALLIPGAALSENFGLKPQRPGTGNATEEPAQDEASGLLDDIDLTLYSDAELESLSNRIYDELNARQSATYGMTIEDGQLLIDLDGVRLSLFEAAYEDDYDPLLRCYVVVENNAGREISISVNDAFIDDIEVSGIGIYDVADGETVNDYFYFQLLDEADDPALLESGETLTFTFEVWDDETYETLFEVPVTLP